LSNAKTGIGPRTWPGFRFTQSRLRSIGETVAIERVVYVAEKGARATVAALGDVIDAGETSQAL